MGLLARILESFKQPEPVGLAERLNDRFSTLVEGLDENDAPRVLNEVRAIDREILAYTDQRGQIDLGPSIEHWAHHVAAPEFVQRVATFFADNKALAHHCQLLVDEGGDRPGMGLLYLQEALNRAGLLMSPTIYDRMAAKTDPKPAAEDFPGEGDRRSRAALAIAGLLWPESEEEMALRQRVAELAGITPLLAGWELFALRAHAFDRACRSAFLDRPAEGGALEESVYDWVKRMIGPGRWRLDFGQWFESRVELYSDIIPTESGEPFAVWSVRWLARARRAFQEALGEDDPALGQLAGVEYDKVLLSLVDWCDAYASGGRSA